MLVSQRAAGGVLCARCYGPAKITRPCRFRACPFAASAVGSYPASVVRALEGARAVGKGLAAPAHPADVRFGGSLSEGCSHDRSQGLQGRRGASCMAGDMRAPVRRVIRDGRRTEASRALIPGTLGRRTCRARGREGHLRTYGKCGVTAACPGRGQAAVKGVLRAWHRSRCRPEGLALPDQSARSPRMRTAPLSAEEAKAA